MKLKDPSSQRYEVHLPGGVPQSKANTQSVLYTTEYQSDPFGFMVRRKSNGRVMWVVHFIFNVFEDGLYSEFHHSVSQ